MNYIHNNPVRAGFVDRLDAYPYSSAYRLGTNEAKIRLSYII
ncbi:MAG: hypothetical protein P4L41_11805 [Flavipsychrobacter sp.]|nr:hypothetical protein [Flavipsychrobacter sp.]